MIRPTWIVACLGIVVAGSLLFAEEGGSAPDAETQRRMEEVLKERRMKEEADRVAGQHALETGRRLKEEGRLEEALESLQKAVSLMPASQEARDELETVQGALGATPDRRREMLEALARSRSAREDQQRVVVEGKVREGQRLIGEKRYEEALQALKEAQETVRWMPYGTPEADHWRSEVGGLLKEAERGSADEAARRQQIQIQQAASEVARDYEASRLQMERRVATLRAQGAEALKAGKWDEAEKAAREIEDLLPGDAGAAHLKLLARERRHVAARTGLKRSYEEEWANLREFAKEQQVPYGGREGDVMRHPDNWQEIQRREQQTVERQQGIKEEPWRPALREKLKATRVPLNFDQQPFKAVKDYLASRNDITINVDKAATDANAGLDDQNISLVTPDKGGVSLETALNLLAKQVGLSWTLRDEAVVITTKDGLKEPPQLQQYDVRDLVGQVLDFAGPTITLGGGGNASNGVKFEEPATSDEKNITGESLVDFVQKYVDKPVWEDQQNSISYRNGRLFVTAPPDTHRKILDVLKGFRDQRTLQVLIQTRFITLNDISFENIGVDWKGLTGPPLPGVTTLPPGNTAGFQNPRGLRTEISGAVVDQGQFLTGVFPRSFNGTPPTIGGLGMQVAFLDTFQAQAVIEAVEKNSKANILTAPTLLAFNTQRANMVSVVQQAYIQSMTAVVQVGAVGYNPEVGYVQTGIVFDVRPIVSADRKYVTLELRPTVSQLQMLRTLNVVTNSQGGNIFIEAPIVQMQAIRTTVSVPDGGTLMIGGLTNYDETHNSSAVPFLSKIPFLQALFSNKADAHNRQSLVILVKTQIVDQKEIEEDRFGKE